jgi:inner membrane protein
MPTFVTHSVVGLAGGYAFAARRLPTRFWVLSAVCPLLPDFDVAAFAVGIPYEHVFGHRGFFHSLTAALLLGVFVTLVFFRQEKIFSKRWWQLTVYFFLISATHGLLDAMTSGGLGIALFAPFDNTRYFLPWTPIEVSPIGISRFFSAWGLRVMVSEFLLVWLPSMALVLVVKLIRRKRKSRSDQPQSG